MNTRPHEPITAKKQECTVAGLYRTGVGYLAGLVFLAYFRNWVGLLLWLVLVPVLKWVYLRFFPRFSRFIGYGRVDDKLPSTINRAPIAVTFYGGLGCPFCPIVLQRLIALQKQMDFTLDKIDVTLHPQLLASKGIRSVPVVEVGQNRLVGHATSEQLAEFIGLAQASESLKAS